VSYTEIKNTWIYAPLSTINFQIRISTPVFITFSYMNLVHLVSSIIIKSVQISFSAVKAERSGPVYQHLSRQCIYLQTFNYYLIKRAVTYLIIPCRVT